MTPSATSHVSGVAPTTSALNWHRFVRWMMFSLAISIIPFGLRFICFRIVPVTHGSLYDMIAAGDLLLVAMAIAAESIGDVVAPRAAAQASIRWMLCCAFSLVAAIMCAFLYAAAGLVSQNAVTAIAGSTVNTSIIVGLSVVLFATVLAIGTTIKLSLPE